MYESSPAFTIPKDSKQHRAEKTPSPDKYVISSKFVGRRCPSWKIGTARRHATRNSKWNLPGPFDYNADKTAVLARVPKFRIGERFRTEKAALGPGPGSYSLLENSIRYRNPASIFTKQIRKTMEQRAGPGPGDYNPVYDLTHTSTSVFGKAKRFKTELSYSSFLSDADKKQLLARSPSYKFGTEKRLETEARESWSPGPTDYKVNADSVLRRPGAAVIGREKRVRSEARQRMSPGPGDYNIAVPSNGPAFALSKSPRQMMIATARLPGPSDYDPKHEYVKQLSPHISQLDGQLRFPKCTQANRQKQVPDPWTYDIKPQHSSGITFPREKRPDLCNTDTPAPNAYNIPTAVAVSPCYSRHR